MDCWRYFWIFFFMGIYTVYPALSLDVSKEVSSEKDPQIYSRIISENRAKFVWKGFCLIIPVQISRSILFFGFSPRVSQEVSREISPEISPRILLEIFLGLLQVFPREIFQEYLQGFLQEYDHRLLQGFLLKYILGFSQEYLQRYK